MIIGQRTITSLWVHTASTNFTFRSWNNYVLYKRPYSTCWCLKSCISAMSFTLCSSSLQALCAVGLCGGLDLRDQGSQEEGESLAHYECSITIEGWKVTIKRLFHIISCLKTILTGPYEHHCNCSYWLQRDPFLFILRYFFLGIFFGGKRDRHMTCNKGSWLQAVAVMWHAL